MGIIAVKQIPEELLAQYQIAKAEFETEELLCDAARERLRAVRKTIEESLFASERPSRFRDLGKGRSYRMEISGSSAVFYRENY